MPPADSWNGQLIVRVNCSTPSAPAGGGGGGGGGGSSNTNTNTTIAPVPALMPVLATVNVTVPLGSRGEVHVPLLGTSTGGVIVESGLVVWEHGKFVAGSDGVEEGGSDGRFVWFYTQAGNYSFTVAFPHSNGGGARAPFR